MDKKKLNIQLQENNLDDSLQENSLSSSISLCGSQCIATKRQIEELTKCIQIKDNRIKDVEQQLSEMQIKLLVYKEMYNEQIKDKDIRIKDVEDQLTQLKIKSLVGKERILLQNEKIKDKNDLIATYEKELSLIKDKIDTLTKKLETDLENEMERLCDVIDVQIKGQKEEIENSVIKTLEKNFANSKSKITRENNQIKNNQQQLFKWENQNRNVIWTRLKSVPNLEPFIPIIESGPDGSSCIVIMRRMDLSYPFESDLNAYYTGFGDPETAYWLGLEKIHKITVNQRHQLYIQYVFVSGATFYYHQFDNFVVGDKDEDYQLKSLSKSTTTAWTGFLGENFVYNDGLDCCWWGCGKFSWLTTNKLSHFKNHRKGEIKSIQLLLKPYLD